MIVSLIVAMDECSGIGKNNRLPWHLPSDLMRFKRITMGHHLVMGRKTYETIGRALPGRVMVIITHQKGYSPNGCTVVGSIQAAIKLADDHHENELFIIGGGSIFTQTIDLADKIYVTIVHSDVGADVFFPKIDPDQWEETVSENCLQNPTDDYGSNFKLLIRKH